MNRIFSRMDFSSAPGGDIYEWVDAETVFDIDRRGLFVIKIEARARNASKNDSTDDDDLRIALDGFHFGKYEQHQEKVSWKGFGTSASWDGASLKGGTKTVYFFVDLDVGEHRVQFFADCTPEILGFEVFEVEDLVFELSDFRPPENIKNDRGGVPWLSFVFLATYPRNIVVDAALQSGKKKGGSDGDNLKVVVNGSVLQNRIAPSSRKYKNFYFSGDLASTGVLSLSSEELSGDLPFESSLEFWYDQTPEINNLRISFFDTEEFLDSVEDLVDLRGYVRGYAWIAAAYFLFKNYHYSRRFLLNSLKSSPENFVFAANHPIVRKIKADSAYPCIVAKLMSMISDGILAGEIHPEDFRDDPEMQGRINFDSEDLATALHGIRKIEYSADQARNGDFELRMKLFDVYDFQTQLLAFDFSDVFGFVKNKIINVLDMGEDLGIVSNFEIEVNIKEILNGI